MQHTNFPHNGEAKAATRTLSTFSKRSDTRSLMSFVMTLPLLQTLISIYRDGIRLEIQSETVVASMSYRIVDYVYMSLFDKNLSPLTMASPHPL